MTKLENAIQITAKFIEARDVLKNLLEKDEYDQALEQWKEYIRKGMAKWDCDALNAAMKLLQISKGSPMSMMKCMAALISMEGEL